MLLAARKPVLFLTLAVYLVTTSVAAAHTKVTTNSASQPAAMSVESCHNLSPELADESAANTCQIFCAVMAVAMPYAATPLFARQSPADNNASFQPISVSYQPAVEPHPPKSTL